MIILDYCETVLGAIAISLLISLLLSAEFWRKERLSSSDPRQVGGFSLISGFPNKGMRGDYASNVSLDAVHENHTSIRASRSLPQVPVKRQSSSNRPLSLRQRHPSSDS